MSIETLKKKALQNGLAAYIVGRSYYSQENGCKQDYETSLRWYKYGYMVLKDPRCEYGYAMFLYDDGESEPEGVIEKDNKLANKLFAEAYPKLKKLAQEGDMYANFILGAYHNYGIGGVTKDFSQAIKYIEESAKLGHSGACYDMGKFLS